MICSRMQRKRHRDFQLWREFEISRPLNTTLESILNLERMIIRTGVSFPAGGSLLLIGRKAIEPIVIRIPFNRPFATGDELDYIRAAIAAPKFSGDGSFTAHCHVLLEQSLGIQKALLTTSCTHALEMAALLLDIGPGDEVIVPVLHVSLCGKCVRVARRQACLRGYSRGHAEH